MIPAFRAAGTPVYSANNVNNPTNLAPTKGGATAVGDLMLCVACSRSITATVATPTGWTLLTGFPKRHGTASGGSIYVFGRVATGAAQDAPTVAWSGVATGTTGDSSSAVIVSYSGAALVQDGTVAATNATSTTAITLPAYTTTFDQSLIVGIVLKILDTASTFTVASPYAERVEGATTSGTGHSFEVSDQVDAVAGANATATVTPSNTTSSLTVAVTLGIAAIPTITLGRVVSGYPAAVGLWMLDENPASHGTVIKDATARGHDGTLSTGDGATNKSVVGQSGRSLTFDGVNDYVSITTKPGDGLGASDFTVVGWIRDTSNQATPRFIIARDDESAGGRQFQFNLHASSLHASAGILVGGIFAGDNIWYQVESPAGTIKQNVWHHVAFRRLAGVLSLWVDGVSVALTPNSNGGGTQGLTIQNTNAECRIGARSYAGSECYFLGDIDRLGINGRGLTDAEMLTLASPGGDLRVRGITVTPGGAAPVAIGRAGGGSGSVGPAYDSAPTQTGSNVAWDTPANAAADDDTNVTVALVSVGSVSNTLTFDNLGLTIPDGATVTDIKVEFKAGAGATGVTYPVWPSLGTPQNVDNTGIGSAVLHSAAGLFGRPWTKAEIESLVVNIQAANSAATAVYLDFLRVTVSYEGGVSTVVRGVTFLESGGASAVPIGRVTGATYATVVQAAAPLAYYRLGESVGTQATDASGNGRHGTYYGPVLGQAGPLGDGNTAAQFDGVDDRVTFPLTIPVGSSITVEFWMHYATADLADRVPFSFDPGVPDRCVVIAWSDGLLYWDYDAGSGGRVSTAYGAYRDKWTHVVLTYNAATGDRAITLDGAVAASATAFANPSSPLVGGEIGRYFTGAPDPYQFKGRLDEFAIYDYALTPAQRLAHYDARSGAGSTTVRGVTLVAGGLPDSTVPVGGRPAVTAVRGVTVAAVGAAPVTVGRRAAATTTRGVTLASAGVAPLPIGRRASATSVRGATLVAAGTVPLVLGSRAAATTARGVTLTGAGTVTVAVGRVGGTAYSAVVLADAPVSYWRLGTGVTIHDEKGVAADVTATGGVSTTGLLTGDADAALAFDGVDDKVSIALVPAHQVNVGTLEIWLKTADAGAGHRGLLVKESAYAMFLFSNELQTYDWAGGGQIPTGVVLNDNIRHHVVMTFQMEVIGGTQFYVDGVAVSTPKTLHLSSQGTGFTIGHNSNVQWYGGVLDEAAFYATNLSPAQIAAHYAAVTGGGSATVVRGVTPSAVVATPQTVPVGRVAAASLVRGVLLGEPFPVPDYTSRWDPANLSTLTINAGFIHKIRDIGSPVNDMVGNPDPEYGARTMNEIITPDYGGAAPGVMRATLATDQTVKTVFIVAMADSTGGVRPLFGGDQAGGFEIRVVDGAVQLVRNGVTTIVAHPTPITPGVPFIVTAVVDG